MTLDSYRTLVLDCDGVILDSNRVKTKAFHLAARPYGEAAAEALVAHHVANGGVSRYAKFAYFIDHIVPEHAPGQIPGQDGPGFEDLLASFAESVRSGLMNCAVAEGLEDFRAATRGLSWCVVSGGDEVELRSVFAARGLAGYFDGGIFGSPDTKAEILEREIASGNIRRPALFVGDSRYDHHAATAAGLDFLFVHGWTEVDKWEEFVGAMGVPAVPALIDILLSELPKREQG